MGAFGPIVPFRRGSGRVFHTARAWDLHGLRAPSWLGRLDAGHQLADRGRRSTDLPAIHARFTGKASPLGALRHG